MQRYNPDTGEYDDVPESPYQNFDQGSTLQPRADIASYGDTPPSGGGGSSGGGGQSNEDWVRQQYQQNFNGRAPTQSEMASELDNLNRYGRDSGPYGGVAAQIAKRATNTPGAGDGGGGGSSLSSAYGNYLGGNQGPAVQSGGQGSDLLSYLQTQQTRQDSERAAMRALLMGKIGEASAPVDVNSPGIREILAAQRLAGQRSAERQQSRLAANLATQGLQSSGAADTGTSAIGQQRGENEVMFTGETLNRELGQKRAQLSDLLHMAMASGDAESARTLQAQLQELDRQQQGQQFGQELGFRKSSFMDDLGFRLMALQLGANQNAYSSFQ